MQSCQFAFCFSLLATFLRLFCSTGAFNKPPIPPQAISRLVFYPMRTLSERREYGQMPVGLITLQARPEAIATQAKW
jgi:hypothetical protein